MPSTAPRNNLDRRHRAVATWLATTSCHAVRQHVIIRQPHPCDVTCRDLVSTPFDGSGPSPSDITAGHHRRTSPPDITVAHRRRTAPHTESPSDATGRPWAPRVTARRHHTPHVTARRCTSPHGTVRRRRASALASPALGGTRARRPKAEHAGRTAPHPRGGNCTSPYCVGGVTRSTVRQPTTESGQNPIATA